MSLAGKTLNVGDLVRHVRFGPGKIRLDEGETAVVRFNDGLQECDKDTLEAVAAPLQEIFATEWHSPIEVVTRAQAAAIESVNDMWSVLSASRIALLPHQLWVCRRVLETWPTRWLVADDVGLGKTIEAGLVFWPLMAKGIVRRLLIICPASLVEQWNQRLRTMFDIRVAIYAGDADTERTDFWGTHDKVVVSLQTLRIENKGRHRRLLESDPWDLVVVDEAHHLNADEKGGPTLGYQVLEKLVENNRVKSMLFFTGTPHRGKTFGFVSLLKLLRSDLFDPKKPLDRQLPHLREVMIRNNKQNVTDLKGNLLFHPPVVKNLEFQFSSEERAFYEMLTDFIQSGQAYASSLDATTGKAVQLVLVAMQKLASSSVAAIRRALRGRLARIAEGRGQLDELQARREARRKRLEKRDECERQGDLDALSRLEEEIAELSGELRLMENEEPRLRELLTAADRVRRETKIDKIVSILHNEYDGRQVLLFTEYKATQSLLMSALMNEFEETSVTFINGDDRADEVVVPSGETKSIVSQRSDATDQFNAGRVRFLVSTEAGGEGIDLQESCHSLVHVDLPWNPMRLHQRVGRLNRYGQKNQVEVVVLRNPETVEGRIWGILQEKMNQIMLALGHAMDEPEDLLQLVLGMSSPSLWRELFLEAQQVPRESLAQWFDHRTAQFGNDDAIKAVQDLVGNCARFDFQQVSDQLPKTDLPALRPFFLSMLKLNRRRAEEKSDGLAFRTPEAWQTEPGIFPAYHGMVFQREIPGRDAARRVLGVGHKVMGEALRQARETSATVATLPGETLSRPLVVYRIRDRLTGEHRTVRSVTLAVEIDEGAAGADAILKDWELLGKLNGLVGGRGFRAKDSVPPPDLARVEQALERSMSLVRIEVSELGLPFRFPEVEPLAVLWPVAAAGRETEEEDENTDNDAERAEGIRRSAASNFGHLRPHPKISNQVADDSEEAPRPRTRVPSADRHYKKSHGLLREGPPVKFAWIQTEKASYPLTKLCRWLGVTPSGFYAWRQRPESTHVREDRRLKVLVQASFSESKQRYGSPRIHADLIEQDEQVSRKRVIRLMQEDGLKARTRKRFTLTTMSDHNQPVAANCLDRQFEAAAPNQRWVGDTTEFVIGSSGKLYLAVVLDLFSRFVVGWAVNAVNDRHLTIKALEMALKRRCPEIGLLHHSDQGCTYASADYQALLDAHGIVWCAAALVPANKKKDPRYTGIYRRPQRGSAA